MQVIQLITSDVNALVAYARGEPIVFVIFLWSLLNASESLLQYLSKKSNI